jgi:hypothetical protein
LSASFAFQGDGVVVTCWGNLNSNDLFTASSNIYAMIEAASLRYYLVDLCDVDSLGFSAENLLLLAQRDKAALQNNPGLKIAFVTNHEVVESVIRLWRGHIDQSEQSVQQFKDMQSACAWVGYLAQQQRA